LPRADVAKIRRQPVAIIEHFCAVGNHSEKCFEKTLFLTPHNAVQTLKPGKIGGMGIYPRNLLKELLTFKRRLYIIILTVLYGIITRGIRGNFRFF